MNDEEKILYNISRGDEMIFLERNDDGDDDNVRFIIFL